LQDCRKKKAEAANATQENTLMTTTTRAVSETTWIVNSGAICHITNDPTNLYNVELVETLVH